MNIVIIGCGELGRHVATILSKERHNIILIDKDEKILQEASTTMDVAIRTGSGSDWQLLDDLLEFSPNLFLALTGSDEVNLVACSIAKQLRYPRTIARVRDDRYLNRTRIDFGHLFNVDYFIGPELLVAYDILKFILNPGSLSVENFAHGALQLRTLVIPDHWQPPADATLKNIKLPKNIIVGLIRRSEYETKEIEEYGTKKKVIFPHGDDAIMPSDEVTFVGETDAICEINRFFGISQKSVQSIVIAGGSLAGFHLARLASAKNIDVRIIEKDYNRCVYLAEHLPDCTVMQHDATDLEFLSSEKIGQADMYVACTNHDELNIMIALLGREVGCDDVIVVLNNSSYIPIAVWLGFRYTASPRISATNQILSQMFSGKVTSLISLYENQAEVMEINVSMNSRLVGIPLMELGPYLPKDLLILMIQNRGRIMIPHGNRIISPGDTVIVVTSPKHIDELGKIF